MIGVFENLDFTESKTVLISNIQLCLKFQHYHNIWFIKFIQIQLPGARSSLRVYVPVSPDLAKTVKVTSDYSKNLTNGFRGDQNDNFT